MPGILPAIAHFGTQFSCPCCGWRFRQLLRYGNPPRQNARCPRCGAMERHRLLWLYLNERTNFFRDRLKVLDIAPLGFFQRRCRSLPNLDYTSADRSDPTAMVAMDITSIPFPDNWFDCILCYHVLEHIPDDRQAIRELARVLKPTGWAIIQSPVDDQRRQTYEDPTVTSPAERARHFGQWDHVRIYGSDYPARLRQGGLTVHVDDYVRRLPAAAIARYCLDQNELLYYCTKGTVGSA